LQSYFSVLSLLAQLLHFRACSQTQFFFLSLRVGEISAINEAIAVIHSDDARDLFKKSISLVQLDSSAATAREKASEVLRQTARASGDMRLTALLARLGLISGAKFDKVMAAIDKMVKTLEDEDKDSGDTHKTAPELQRCQGRHRKKREGRKGSLREASEIERVSTECSPGSIDKAGS